jgi:L-fucose mutarotase
MLKGIDPIIGPELIRILRAMGHGDEIAIVDANYPAEEHAKRLVRMDGHGTPRILDAVLSVMPVDSFVPQAVFRPAAHLDPQRIEAIFSEFELILKTHEPEQRIHALVGDQFYQRVRGAFAVVASGERRLYGNIIVRKGVIHPS